MSAPSKKQSHRSVAKFPTGGSFEHFVEEFLVNNRPCLFDESLTRQWPSRQLWVDDQGRPNLDYLNKKYGDYVVPVADCGLDHFSTHPKSEMKMADYLAYLAEQREQAERGDITKKLLYLKDWHLARDNTSEAFYTTLDFFKNDWLNEAWLLRQDVHDDYRFVYMGQQGTWTPFHADVFRSYSWSTNVCGCKEWFLFPPGEEDYLHDTLGNLPFDVTNSDLRDCSRYPDADKACKPIHIVQNSGETIFVPSGWYHQVKNIKDTISINHNWTNGFGLKFVWRHLQSELNLVRAELDDCKSMDGWEHQCQVVLRAYTGMDYWEFTQFLCVIGLPRLREARMLLSSISGEADRSILDSIEQRLSKITTSSRKLTFFENGTLPPELELTATPVADSLSVIPHDCLRVGAKATNTDSLPFSALLPLLSKNFQAIASKSCGLLNFRLFELHAIDCVLDEILPFVLPDS